MAQRMMGAMPGVGHDAAAAAMVLASACFIHKAGLGGALDRSEGEAGAVPPAGRAPGCCACEPRASTSGGQGRGHGGAEGG